VLGNLFPYLVVQAPYLAAHHLAFEHSRVLHVKAERARCPGLKTGVEAKVEKAKGNGRNAR
jgi:hypothetical protein